MSPTDLLALAFALLALAGGLLAHLAALQRRERGLAGLEGLLLADALMVGLCLLAWRSPPAFEAAMQEDAWAEWATTFAHLTAAGLLGFAALRQVKERQSLRALSLAGLAVFCFVVAGEEISWGQRLFAFRPPEVFLEHNFQQELNVHNFLKGKQLGPMKLDSRYLVALLAAVLGVAGPALARTRSARRLPQLGAVLSALPPAKLAFVFAAVCAVSLSYPVDLAGEACELVFGVGLLLGAAIRSGVRSRRWLLVPVLPLLVGAVTPHVTDRLLEGTRAEREALARRELRDLVDRLDLSTLQLPERGRVHKRVFTAVRDGYLSFEGLPAEPRRTFFLDPWNNPYWLTWRGKRGTLLLYSFGSNRRRDVDPDGDLDSAKETPGDDVVLVLRPRDGSGEPLAPAATSAR